MTRFPTWKVLVCLILTMPLPVLAVDDYQFERSIGKPPSIGEPINLAVDAAGNMLVTDRANGKIVRATPQGQISSPFTEAQGLRRPSAITFGPNGRLLVADEQQGGRVFSFASARPGAARRIIALAPGTAATGFGESSAGGIAADTAGNIYVTDQFRSVVSKFSPSGERLATFGKKGSEPGAFQGPRGIAVDRQGNVYVADEYNNRIQKLDPEGRVLAMSDAQALGATVAGGLGPMSVAVDSKGEIWVAAHTNFAVYKLDPNFHISVRLETFGRLNGQLAGPVSVAVDAQDNVYVLDRSRRIQKFSPIGNFMSKVEFPPAKPGELTAPTGVLVDRDGTSVWVSDTANFRIQKFAADGTPLLTFGRFGQGDGEFNGAESIAQDRDGNLWIVDSYNHRVQKFAPDGRFLLKVGSMGRGNGEFLRTKVVATDDTRGYVYVNDWHNARVQKFDLNGRFLASFGNAGDFKQQVTGPTGLAIDKAGNVYVSSWFNNAIQKFDSNGKWLATLGGPGSGDGQFKGPARLSMTPDGRLVVADWGNSRVQVLEEAGGFVTKFGSPGRANGAFDQPVGVSVDGAGNVFVSDAGNSRVQLFHFSKHTELPITSPVRHAAAPGGHRDVFVQVSIYDIADGHDMDFERALQETRPLLQAERSFINERVLRNIDGFTLQYATYSKFSDETAADQTTRSRLRSLLPYCRRAPETHLTRQTDAFTLGAVTSRPTGRELGEGSTGQIAHLGLFIPIPHYAEQYFKVLKETKALTRARRPEGYLGEDLLVETQALPPTKQTPYSPRPEEASPMSVNYGEYTTMESAEDSYITRQVQRDQNLVTMERTFFSSLQVPTRFYIFQVIANFGRGAEATRSPPPVQRTVTARTRG